MLPLENFDGTLFCRFVPFFQQICVKFSRLKNMKKKKQRKKRSHNTYDICKRCFTSIADTLHKKTASMCHINHVKKKKHTHTNHSIPQSTKSSPSFVYSHKKTPSFQAVFYDCEASCLKIKCKIYLLWKRPKTIIWPTKERRKKNFEIVNHKANTIFTVILMPALEWKQDRKMSNTSCFFRRFCAYLFVCGCSAIRM